MTDNEIIKALECCSHRNEDLPCDGCPAYNIAQMCMEDLMSAALDLINRQKEKNESLKVDLAKCSIRLDNLYKTADEIKSKAIKEFAHFVIDRSRNGVIYASDIPDLVKEMTEVSE